MEGVYLSDSERVRDGLDDMMSAMGDLSGLVYPYVQVEIALLIVEIAKRAPDKAEWFVHGKWATIQSLEGKIREVIDAAIAAAGNEVE